MTEPARAELDRTLSLSFEEAPRFDPALDTPRRRVTPGSRVISLLDGCRVTQKPYDLLIHFHGAPPVIEAAVEKADIDGALVIFNWGIGSGAYEDKLASPGSFDQLLAGVDQGVRELCPGAAKPKGIGLGGGGAGHR